MKQKCNPDASIEVLSPTSKRVIENVLNGAHFRGYLVKRAHDVIAMEFGRCEKRKQDILALAREIGADEIQLPDGTWFVDALKLDPCDLAYETCKIFALVTAALVLDIQKSHGETPFAELEIYVERMLMGGEDDGR